MSKSNAHTKKNTQQQAHTHTHRVLRPKSSLLLGWGFKKVCLVMSSLAWTQPTFKPEEACREFPDRCGAYFFFLAPHVNFLAPIRLFCVLLRIRCGAMESKVVINSLILPKELENHPKIHHSPRLGDLKIKCGTKRRERCGA